MSLILDITDETGRVPEDRLAEIEKLLQFAAAEEGVADGAEVSVTIVNNEEIAVYCRCSNGWYRSESKSENHGSR